MKYFRTLLCAGFVLLFSGCYDNEGGHDYDTTVPDVNIVIPQTAYSGSLGDKIHITPEISTDISSTDLQYIWEVSGERRNESGRECYVPMIPDSEQGMDLNYTCKLDTNIAQMNKSYKCRLHVKQKSTGRDFYSSSSFTITIQGITGLLVLEGDDSQCDVGILMGKEFMPASSAIPEEATATAGLYSMNANGKGISGKGISIVQPHPNSIDYFRDKVKDNCRIVVMTDQTARVLNRGDLSVFGDWSSLFYLQGDRKVNSGNPKGFVADQSWDAAFDGNDVFIMDPTQQSVFLFPTFSSDMFIKGHKYTFAPFLTTVNTNGIQKIFYVNSVDGKTQKGFAGFTNGGLQNAEDYLVLLDTKDDAVAFNPGDMKAELVKMSLDARGHLMAIMKGDANHPSYPNQYFLADLLPNAVAAGASGFQGVPQQLCDMKGLNHIDEAKYFEFGHTVNEMYYSTDKQVYHYGLDGATLTSATPLQKRMVLR